MVLLLNATYEPIRIITARRAITMLLTGKAVAIENGERLYHSETSSIAVPRVIKLAVFVQIPFKANYPLNRRALLVRDNHRCQVTGCERSGTTIDHVKPRSRGGKHTWTNVALMCSKHNFAKADKTLKEMGWTLKREPRAPQGTMWLLIGVGIDPEDSWVPYLDPAAMQPA